MTSAIARPRRSSPSLPLLAALCLAGCAVAPAQAPGELRDGTVLSADDVVIHFREGGQGDTALVFVHGWLGNASWWEPVMQRFAPTHRVVALDLAGHGRSGGYRAEWTVAGFAADVAAVVRALDLQRAVLVGHSMSGAITVEVVFSWPGLGTLTQEALASRDYPLLQGIFVILAISVVVANFAADLVYGFLDPRVKA